MTREEAREILTHNWTRVDNPNYSESELDEAFFMAIEALTLQNLTEPNNTCGVDLISRADAMAEFREWVKRANENGETPTWNDAVSLIGSLPSADAVHGEWVDVENEPYCECSVCGSYIDNLDDVNE